MSKLGVCISTSILEDLGMNPDLDTLATALYVRIDDLLADNPGWAPRRPRVGIAPKLSDAELITLAVISALLGFDSERGFVRFAREHLGPWFPYVPNHDGFNKRLRQAGPTIGLVIGALARDCPDWHDDVWLADSTPVPCGTSRPTAQRSDLAGWAQYGYCASHSRYFWGLRLHLIATPAGLPVAFALAGAKADEREVCADMIAAARIARAGQTLIADKGYRSTTFETGLNDAGITLCECLGDVAVDAQRNSRWGLGCWLGGVRLAAAPLVGLGGGDLEAVVFA